MKENQFIYATHTMTGEKHFGLITMIQPTNGGNKRITIRKYPSDQYVRAYTNSPDWTFEKDTASAFSWQDQSQGYPRRRWALANLDSEQLKEAYRKGMRDCFHGLFCQNAQQHQDLIAQELLSRGIEEIPNEFFSPLKVKDNWSDLGPAKGTARA